MISLMNKYKKVFFVGTTAMFLVATLVGLGSYLGAEKTEQNVVTVGKLKVPALEYQQTVNSKMEYYRQQGLPTEALEPQVKRMVLNDMVTDAIFAQAAQDSGMTVSDFEVSAVIRSQKAFYAEGKFSPEMYYRLIWEVYHVRPDEYEARLRQSRLAENFKRLAASSVKILPGEAEAIFLAENKSLKGFEAKKDEYIGEIQRQKATALINYYLQRYLTANKVVEFKENM